jgi:chromosome segregation ATPase
MELNGYKQSINTSQDQSEALAANLKRLQSESAYLEKQIQMAEDTKEKLNENYAMYTKALMQSEVELAKAIQEKGRHQKTLSQLQKEIHTLSSTTQKLEMEIMVELQNQSGCEKHGTGTKRDGVKLKQTIYEKLGTIAQLQNDITRLRVEAIDYISNNNQLQQQLTDCEEQIQQQNAVIEKYESEIKRQTDELNKKQSEMTLLNRKYDQLMAQHAAAVGAVKGEIGPLEATIHNYQKSIVEQEKNSVELQQFWLKAQNDLVAVTKSVEEAREYITDAKMKRMVLERKKTVINAQFEREENDIKELQRNIRKIQADMVKINVLLSKHTKVQQQFEENNLNLEYEFRGRLKDAEMECMDLEQNIDRLRQEKDEALTGLVDAE